MTVTVTIPYGHDHGSREPDTYGARKTREKPPPKPRNKYLKFLSEQVLVTCFGLACLFGYLWPDVAATGGPIRSEYSILYGSVALIFLISGLQLSTQKLRENLFNWRLHIIVQGISFVVIPAVVQIIVWIIIAAGDLRTKVIDYPVLIGMIITSCLPTTIASNIVMTRNAGGDDSAAIIEVVIGNVFGSFLSPGLIYVLIPNEKEFEDWMPVAPSALGDMYKNVSIKLSLTVILPLVVGQTVRIFFERQVAWCVRKLHIGKLATFALCTLVWSTFSNAFKTGAIQTLPPSSLVFNIIMNIFLYALFTLICFVIARPPHDFVKKAITSRLASYSIPGPIRRFIIPKQMSKEQAVAVCFCGAAKTTSVGIPLVAVMWASQDEQRRAYLQIPVLLYTMEQVFLAQILVYVFKWHLKRNVHSDLDVESSRGGVEDLDGAAEPRGAGPEAALRQQQQHGFVDVKL